MPGYTDAVTGFSTPQTARLSGASYRQLDYWSRTGVLTPSLADAAGSGSQRRYSIEDVALARLVCQISRQGHSLRFAAALVAALRDPDAWDAFLVIVDDRITVTLTPGAVLADQSVVFAQIVSPAAALAEVRALLVDREVPT